jgi:hypothetical protein
VVAAFKWCQQALSESVRRELEMKERGVGALGAKKNVIETRMSFRLASQLEGDKEGARVTRAVATEASSAERGSHRFPSFIKSSILAGWEHLPLSGLSSTGSLIKLSFPEHAPE